ncbi:hypothetical protein ACJX0J_021312, partial [Zea mays]
CITAMKISFFYDCFLSWEVGGFFYHEYFFSNILFILHALTCYYSLHQTSINSISQLLVASEYSSLVDNFSLEISKTARYRFIIEENNPVTHMTESSIPATGKKMEQYYEMIISLVFVYYVSFFCNIMFFAIFRNEDDSHIWKQLMVMCRFLENIEVALLSHMFTVAYDALELEHVKILVGITGGDIGSVGITGGDMTRWSTSTLPSRDILVDPN